MQYKLSESSVNEFIFINDSTGISIIKKILDKRLLEYITKPIVFPSPEDNIPIFLREILDKIPNESPAELLEEFYQDEEEESFRSVRGIPTLGQTDTSGQEDTNGVGTMLPADTEVVVCIDSDGRGMFLSSDSSVMILKGDLFDEVDTSLKGKALSEALRHKEIVIGKNQLYSSFKGVFLRYIMKNPTSAKPSRFPYQWNTYNDLYSDSTEWIRYILISIEQIRKTEHITEHEAKEKVIDILSKADCTGKDANTIRLWLRPIDQIRIEDIAYDIYRTERPSHKKDIHIIFETLSQYIPDPDKYDPDKSYVATLYVQEMRNKVLRGGKNLENKAIRLTYEGLKKERALILMNADTFYPEIVRRDILSKPAETMKILGNYAVYL